LVRPAGKAYAIAVSCGTRRPMVLSQGTWGERRTVPTRFLWGELGTTGRTL
jgi:hypothetical protein